MRLEILNSRVGPGGQPASGGSGAIRRRKLPAPVRVMSYRRDLFGKYFAASLQEGMREVREWSIGEVELFAAFISDLNKCKY